MDKEVFLAVLQGICANTEIMNLRRHQSAIVATAEEIAKEATHRLQQSPTVHTYDD